MKPPDKENPLVIFSRPSYDWVNRINVKSERLTKLKQSATTFEQISRSLEFDCARSVMSLESDRRTVNVADRQSESDFDPLQAIRTVVEAVRRGGKNTELTPKLLVAIRFGSSGTGEFRSNAGDPTRGVRPVPANRLGEAIANACQWFTADSFRELNPVEQASIAFLRLIELQPFDSRNEESGLIGSSIFTLRRGLPPVIIGDNRLEQYRSARAAGLAMNTTALVDFFAHSVEESLDGVIALLEKEG